jgi:dTDP-glucose 4,6-dehydratase/UDP-glucuronate decarboxylase
MRVLVTGGAGFIGSNLSEHLVREGHSVTVADNFLTGSLDNIEHLLGRDDFQLLNVDVAELPDVGVDAVFHLASPASPVGYGRYPIETLVTNAEGTHRVLDVARASKARFLLASTSEIYGDPLEHPQTESYWGNVDPTGPRSCYDEGKRYAEALTTWYGITHGVDVRIVRIFNCYGPRNAPDDGRMVPNFINQALRGEAITIYGDGSQTRSLCYVSDLVRGLELALSAPGTRGNIYNLGNPQEFTVREFAEIIREEAGSTSSIVSVDGRPGEIARRKPDISKAQHELGWSPHVDVRDGIRDTIAWYSSFLAARPVASQSQ